MKYLSLLMVLILGGCANVGPGKPMPVTLQSAPMQQRVQDRELMPDLMAEPDALQVLFNEGLAEDAQYESARFIEGSNETMIIASVLNVPCQMVFRFVEATNGDFWIPNQIACDNQDAMAGYVPEADSGVISSADIPMINSAYSND
ncbi:hypothetical protein AB7W30_18550 [Providencia manganoxydans]|uniref:hypothetical protein n=3 Tax=Morganellaceae TaxID=1903414 RepID=UPI0032DA8E60